MNMKNNSKLIIGIVGGMGSYATVHYFKRIVDAFPAEKEWERPHIIIDNRCTMPSRVRAILYNENKSLLIDELVSSVSSLLSMGATQIVLACNTSHFFLKDIIKKLPEAEGKVVNIIEALAEELVNKNRKKVYLLATEGTILSGIYNNVLSKYDIECCCPEEEMFFLIREFIEGVKQNKITHDLKLSFAKYLNEIKADNIILGCTELPVLYDEMIKSGIKTGKIILDPLESSLNKIKMFSELS